MKRILVCGDRNWKDKERIKDEILSVWVITMP